MKLTEQQPKDLEAKIKSENPPNRILLNYPNIQPITEPWSDEMLVWSPGEKRYVPKPKGE